MVPSGTFCPRGWLSLAHSKKVAKASPGILLLLAAEEDEGVSILVDLRLKPNELMSRHGVAVFGPEDVLDVVEGGVIHAAGLSLRFV